MPATKERTHEKEERYEQNRQELNHRGRDRNDRPRPRTRGGHCIYSQGESWNRNEHYNDTRYHGLNLHAVDTKGTVEFRVFNSTLHAGKVKAYIQFCMAVVSQALAQKSASPTKTTTTNPKYTFRTWLLRLGLIGEEYATCRKWMLEKLEGDSAFRDARRLQRS